ncbi:Phospholipase A2 [Apiospora phragmitis]|uniref:Phospholipase A2 n=1 Tax=Apiospora phragmitis TaxID=2905665 RepID=A0ABR1VET0_9PEZI
MKSVLITAALLPLALAAAALEPRNNNGCNADNCARAVTGTRRGPASISAFKQDCTSFMSATVTPPTSTATVTVTPDTCDEDEQAPLTLKKQKRAEGVTVFPTAVPTYASACSGAVRYSSACSCWGVSAAFTTAPTPVVTVTVTGY